MPLTREFKETVQARLRADRKYRKELLREGVERFLAGDLDTGKAILRDYINATIGFEELSPRTKRPAKSLMRMLSPSVRPRAQRARMRRIRPDDQAHLVPVAPPQAPWLLETLRVSAARATSVCSRR